MNKDHQLSLQKSIGLVILYGLGIVPLVLWLILDALVIHPYVAIISTIIGAYIQSYVKKVQRGDVHDR